MHVHTCVHFSAVGLEPGTTKAISSDCIRNNETIVDLAGHDLTKSVQEKVAASYGFQQKTLNSHGYQ